MLPAHENPLTKWIKQRIKQSPTDNISFHDYMHACLYHPDWGYYSSSRTKLGREGDFYTSAYVGDWMGRILARCIIEQLMEYTNVSQWSLTEWGGGTGRLACHVMDELKHLHPEYYAGLTLYMVEHNVVHQAALSEALAAHQAKVRVVSEDDWFESDLNEAPMIVYSNELLDAFPVYRVKQQAVIKEIFVTWDEQAQCFKDQVDDVRSEALLKSLEEEPMVLMEGQETEVNVDAGKWIVRIGRKIREGCLISIDYGDLAEELYAEHRMRGTLMCYYRHTASDDPYVRVGEQDITAHVNFSSCIHAGKAAGLNRYQLLTQKDFLVDYGILDYLQDHHTTDPFSPQARQNRSIRQLLISDQMSELFKVLIQTRTNK